MAWQSWGLASCIALAGWLSIPLPTLAQSITLDGTLGPNGPIPTLAAPGFSTVYDIRQNLGQTVGSNLFHSFGKFNLTATEAAFFRSAPEIRNIFSRVTGGTESSINGLITTQSTNVNLFLINPAGIVFGPNSRLNIGSSTRGSFVATTLDAITFANGDQFSAQTPNSANSLLRIVGDPSGFIAAQRTIPPIVVRDNRTTNSNLSVSSGQSLLLLGGNVILNNSLIGVFVPGGGRVEIGGITGAGQVDLLVQENRWQLGFPVWVNRSNVTITNATRLDVRGETGGNLTIHAHNLEISGSSLFAGISANQTNPLSQAGDIVLNVTDRLVIRGSLIGNDVNSRAQGNGGNLVITAGTVQVRNSSQLSASTRGTGNAGNVVIRANTISLDGNPTAILSSVGQGGQGQGGRIDLTVGNLSLTNGAQMITSTQGRGDAGNVVIRADAIALDNESAIFSNVAQGGQGRGGNINLTTGNLSLTHGAQLIANTRGNGDAGNVVIHADAIALSGLSNNDLSSAIITRVVGKTGNGQGGSIDLTTSNLSLTDGAQLVASTEGYGNAGNVLIRADAIALDNESTIFTNVELGGIGHGGDINLTAKTLRLTNGAQLVASTEGYGNAGNVVIRADAIALNHSSIFSSVEESGQGYGGNINLATGALSLSNGAQLIAVTQGIGNAGKIQVVAGESIQILGSNATDGFSSGLFAFTSTPFQGGDITLTTPYLLIADGALVDSRTFGVGNAGQITIAANRIDLQNGGQLLNTSQGRGSAGTITVNADRLTLTGTDDTYTTRHAQFGGAVGPISPASGIFTESASGNGGNIILNIGELLLLRNGSQISTTAGTAQAGGDGGNITINAPRGFIVGVKRENSDITANAFTGSGGRINITAQGVYGLQFRPQLTSFSDITASSTFGLSGTVAINTLGIDPNRGLVSLPDVLVDPSRQIVQTCVPQGPQRTSSFVVTGRGGIPLSPDEPLQGLAISPTWISLPEEQSGNPSAPSVSAPPHAPSPSPLAAPSPSEPTQLVEAQRIVKLPNGQIYLVADAPNGGLPGPWLPMLDCGGNRLGKMEN